MGKSHLFSAYPIDLKTYAANPHCVLSDRKYRNTDSRDALCAPHQNDWLHTKKILGCQKSGDPEEIYLRAS